MASWTSMEARIGCRPRLVLAGFDLGEGEQVFGETVHAAGVLENDGHEFAGVIGHLHLVFEEGLDVAGDRGERSAEFVGDVGDEIAAGFFGALDFGDVMEDGDGSAIGRGRGADFKGAARDDGDGAAAADAALAEGDVNTTEDLRGRACSSTRELCRGGRPGAMRCMTELDQLTWPLAFTATTASCMESSRAASSRCFVLEGVEGLLSRPAVASSARETSPISSLPSSRAGSEIAGGDAAGEIDDVAQPAAMR